MKQSAARRAGRQAEKIHEEIYGKKEGEESADEILDGLDGEPEAAPEEAAPEEAAEEAAPEEAAAEPAPQEEAADEPVRNEREADERWQEQIDRLDHKYKVLQGMHRKLLEENMDLRNQVAEAAAKPAPATGPTNAQPSAAEMSLLSAEEIEDYTPEMVDVMKRAAREAVASELAELKAENKRLHAELSGVTTQIDTSAKSNIYARLDAEVTNWREINESDEFLSWLTEPDMFSGELRQSLLRQAFDANDAARVIRFFKAYLNEDAAVAPAVPHEPEPATPVTPKVDMRSMVAPGKPKHGGAPSDQADTRVFSQREISEFYKSVQLGKFPGTEADKLRMERAIIKAANEGRVQQ